MHHRGYRYIVEIDELCLKTNHFINPDVGKTSLSMRYCHGEFPENATPTIGASFLQRRVVVDGTEISLQIWDTAGQERFRSMAPMVLYY